ncbi:hypothetical protein [Muricoccus radiodurans]|uniref:hypothetical protein n=1 Tax=Muricoccus radiodurans TaxID=2231721 RepID=UPI003CF0F9EE
MTTPGRHAIRAAAVLAMAGLAACAPVVGPYEQQAAGAAQACQQGYQQACYDYQALAPAANAEAAQNAQNAQVGTAVAAGVIGAAAGAAIVGATTRDRGYRRGYYDRPRRYYYR